MSGPGWLEAAISSGLLPGAALVLLVAETAALCVVLRRRGGGPQASLVANALAGAGLLAALLAHTTGAGAMAVAAALAVGLIGHVADLALRIGAASAIKPSAD